MTFGPMPAAGWLAKCASARTFLPSMSRECGSGRPHGRFTKTVYKTIQLTSTGVSAVEHHTSTSTAADKDYFASSRPPYLHLVRQGAKPCHRTRHRLPKASHPRPHHRTSRADSCCAGQSWDILEYAYKACATISASGISDADCVTAPVGI